MKKQLILLTLLALSSNLFSMEEKQAQTKQLPKTEQLSRWEKFKVGSALAGCALCTWATLFNRSTRQKELEFAEKHNQFAPNDELPDWSLQHIPSVLTALPFGIIKAYLLPMSIKTGYNLSAACSSIAAIALGTYAYKKLTQPSKHKNKSIS